MKRRGYLCLIIILHGIAILSHAQQGNVWHFGFGAGITFNTDPPSALLDGKLFTREGCSGISDKNGQLLFYTDGATVWNSLHQVMLNGNGLKGQLSSSNAAIVIPKPGADAIYYIFTSGSAETGNEGYFYSEVDMSLQGGLGAVTNKNVFLYGRSTEKLTAVRHTNGIDVWVITKELNNLQWHVFKVDCNGVHTTPVTSTAGYLPDPMWTDINVGYLRASPDGTKIASVNTGDGVWELLQFDAATGGVSNGLEFRLNLGLFGAEFSPDSKLLYIGVEDIPFQQAGGVYQYNLANYDATAIASTQLLVSNTDSYVGALQLGPDNKIYCALEFTTFLGVINAPNVPGMGCSYVDKQIDLKGKEVFRGLPVYFPGLITAQHADFNYTVSSNCATVNFLGNTTLSGGLHWEWDFGDGTKGTGQAVSHTYTAGNPSTGNVTLTVSTTGLCGTASVIKKVNVDPGSQPVAQFDVNTQCGQLSVAFADASATGPSLVQQWHWNFGDGTTSAQQDPAYTYASFGTYTVKLWVQSANGCTSDTTSRQIEVRASPTVSFTHTKACMGDPIQFTNQSSIPVGAITNYAWNFGDGTSSTEINPVHRYNSIGDFTATLKAFADNGCTAEAATTFHMMPVNAFAGNDTTVAIGQPVQLHATGGVHYRWFPPDHLNTDTVPNPVAILHSDQHYQVTVTTAEGCVDTDDIFIQVFKGPDIHVPNAFTPDGQHKIFRPLLAGIQQLHFFSVYNRWGQLVFTTQQAGKGWDGRINGVIQPTGTYVWTIKAKDYQGKLISKNGTVLLIR